MLTLVDGNGVTHGKRLHDIYLLREAIQRRVRFTAKNAQKTKQVSINDHNIRNFAAFVPATKLAGLSLMRLRFCSICAEM